MRDRNEAFNVLLVIFGRLSRFYLIIRQKLVAISREIEVTYEDIWELTNLLHHVDFVYIPRSLSKNISLFS